MAKKHIVYHEKIHGKETIIYYIEGKSAVRRKYFVVENVPNKYQNNPKALEKLNAQATC